MDSFKDRVLRHVAMGLSYTDASKMVFRELQTLYGEHREVDMMPVTVTPVSYRPIVVDGVPVV